MVERGCDLSAFAEVIPDEFVKDTRSWYDEIPNMPELGHGRFEASRTYEHIVKAFTAVEKEQQQFSLKEVNRIFDFDKQRIDKLRDDPSFDPSLDYSLKNVLAIGVWYETEELEKEEGSTSRYQMLHQVNSLIQQVIDLACPSEPSATPGK